ncbi:MAG: TPM domain-containing protein [Kofleriaceae bacterium]
MTVTSVVDVPSPRPAGWVSDHTGVLDAERRRQINALAEQLHADRGIELTVVIVDDVADTPKKFATALFNRWGIGSAQTNNGLLVLLVMSQRRLEIETGRGMEGALTAGWLADMQRQTMVPRFKARDFGGGLLAGVTAIDEHVRAAPGESASIDAPGTYASNGSNRERITEVAAATDANSSLPAVTPAVSTSQPSSVPPSVPPSPSSAAGTSDGVPLAPIAAGGAAAAASLAGIALLVRNQRRRRICFNCKPPREMTVLDETADDAHLEPGQRSEERVGSVDYEVLICPRCQASRTFRNDSWLSHYSKCPGCSYETGCSTSTTITVATYDHGGEVEVVESCAHCSYHKRYVRNTSALTRPSESSSSSSSWSPSSDSSSSSSSDSGFSGGGSGGGGAGTSW